MPVLELKCPCCSALLTVDAESAAVLRHRKQRSKKPRPNLLTEIQRLQLDEQTRGKRFTKQFQAAEHQSSSREKRFEGLLKQAKHSRGVRPPTRDIDLD